MNATALNASSAILSGMADYDDWQSHCQSVAQSVLDWAYNHIDKMWFSAGGGTANVLAGCLSGHLGVPFQQAMNLLDSVGGGDAWFHDLLWSSNQSMSLDMDMPIDAAGVAKFLTRQDRVGGSA